MAGGTTTQRDEAGGATPATPDESGQERNPFRRVWWLPVVRGTLLVVLGLLLMIEPLEQLGTLRFVLGAFLVADGVLVAVQGFVHRKQVGVGVVARAGRGQRRVRRRGGAVAGPRRHGAVLRARRWGAVGITTIAGAAALVRNRDLGWAWMLAVGIVSVLFGILLVTRPSTRSTCCASSPWCSPCTRSCPGRSTWSPASRSGRSRGSSPNCARRRRGRCRRDGRVRAGRRRGAPGRGPAVGRRRGSGPTTTDPAAPASDPSATSGLAPVEPDSGGPTTPGPVADELGADPSGGPTSSGPGAGGPRPRARLRDVSAPPAGSGRPLVR